MYDGQLSKTVWLSRDINALVIYCRRVAKTEGMGVVNLKVHKIENFFDSDFGICVISLLVMHK
jgi:hypothetical protein